MKSSDAFPEAKRLHIFLCANQEFRDGVFVTIASLIEHLDPLRKTTIHLLSSSFNERSIEQIESVILQSGKSVRFDFKKIELTIFSDILEKQKRNVERELADEIYGRLLIPSMFPAVSFGIYLDSDILIQKDLAELLVLEDSAVPLFAVRDYGVATLSHPGAIIDWKERNLSPDAPYFNSGFLVMNLNLWDRNDLIPDCISIGRRTKFDFPDQSILNIIFAEKWQPLGSMWNHMCYPGSLSYAFPSSGINYHFIGPTKPWFWPNRFAFGCVRNVHKYIDELPPDSTGHSRQIQGSYLVFFVRSQLKRWAKFIIRLSTFPYRKLVQLLFTPVAKSVK